MSASWDRRSTGEQDRVEGLVLSRWLPAAASFAPWWAQRLADHGIDVDALTDRDALATIPPSREAQLVTAGGPGAPGLVMRPSDEQVKALGGIGTLLAVARAIRRDGGDGMRREILREYKPIQVLRGGIDGEIALASTRSDLDRLHRAGARAAALLGLTDADYLVSAVPSGPRLEFWGVYHLALGASMLALHPRGAGADLAAVVDAFDLAPITAVAVRPDEAVALAGLLGSAPCSRLETVVLVGPPPDADTRAEVEDAFRQAGAADDLVARALWAPTQARALWAECRQGREGLHTSPDLEVLEVLDPVTGDVADAAGDLTYTSAGWHGTALLRLRAGTRVESLTREPCPACGRTVPRVVGEVAPGKWQPVLAAGPQYVRADLRGAAAALASTPGLTTWRTELRPPSQPGAHDRLAVEVAGDIDDDALDDLYDRIEAATGVAPDPLEWYPDADGVDRRAQDAASIFADRR